MKNSQKSSGQNTEKSPGDLKRLAVTQTPVKNYRLTLVWKSLKKSCGQNTEKSPGDLKRLAVTQTPVKNYRLTLVETANTGVKNSQELRAEYWEESWRLEETCCHSNSSEKLSANTGVKNSQKSSGQNTEKSPGDLKRLAVTQTPVKNYRLTLVWKTLKRVAGRILRRVLETWRDLLSLKLQWKTIS